MTTSRPRRPAAPITSTFVTLLILAAMPQLREPSFAVVIPAFNEVGGIGACVEAVESALAPLPNRTAIVVVDDGSTDGTTAALSDLEPAHSRLIVVRHPINRG